MDTTVKTFLERNPHMAALIEQLKTATEGQLADLKEKIAAQGKNIQDYFDNWEKVDVLHFTSDGHAFFEDSDAFSHARTLQDKDVTIVYRSDLKGGSFDTAHDTYTAPTGEVPGAPATIDHTITQADLDGNPEFVSQGLIVGDVIQVPVEAGKTEQQEVAATAKGGKAKKK